MTVAVVNELKPLISLLVVVNPIACVPFFIHYTEGLTRAQKAQTVRVAAFSCFVVIATCALLGLAAFHGLARENMTRAQAWRFLDMGLRIERAPFEAHGKRNRWQVSSDSLT